tara:strand:+ start:10 stop:669 length:660 start_codon:yes stop_codon:yes gene_type:complete
MKLITFSLWGQNPKYLYGSLRNAELAKVVYPGWKCRFYVAASVPFPIISQLKAMDHVEVVHKPSFGDWKAMFWRFEPASEPSVDVMISRDADSRLSTREKAAVDEWLSSDKGFHIMRDHPWHKFPVLGGMWGIKKDVLPNMKELISGFSQEDQYGTDYKFFAEIIPLLGDNIITHDEFFTGNPFPHQRDKYEFVGQVFDENDNPVIEHVDVLKKYYENK